MTQREYFDHIVEPAEVEPPDLLARLLTTSQAIDNLGDVFAVEEPLDEIARQVAETALAANPHADLISITVLSGPIPAPRPALMQKPWHLMTSSTPRGVGRVWTRPCNKPRSRRSSTRKRIGRQNSSRLRSRQEFAQAYRFRCSSPCGERTRTGGLAQCIQPRRNRFR